MTDETPPSETVDDSELAGALERLATMPPPDPDAPMPLYAGSYAIYADGKGGFVMVADVNGKVERRHIPRTIVEMVNGGGGVVGQLTRRMRKAG